MNNLEIIRSWSSWAKTNCNVSAGVTPAPEQPIVFSGSNEPSDFLRFATSDGGVVSIWSNKSRGDFTVGPVVWFSGNDRSHVLVLGTDAVTALAVMAGFGMTTIEEFWLGAEPDAQNRALAHWLRQTWGGTVPTDVGETVRALTAAHAGLAALVGDLPER